MLVYTFEKTISIRVVPDDVVSLEIENAHFRRNIAHELPILLVFLQRYVHTGILIGDRLCDGGQFAHNR